MLAERVSFLSACDFASDQHKSDRRRRDFLATKCPRFSSLPHDQAAIQHGYHRLRLRRAGVAKTSFQMDWPAPLKTSRDVFFQRETGFHGFTGLKSVRAQDHESGQCRKEPAKRARNESQIKSKALPLLRLDEYRYSTCVQQSFLFFPTAVLTRGCPLTNVQGLRLR